MQSEATEKLIGMGRGPPNDYPVLTTPAEGQGWSDVFAAFAFELPNLGLKKTIIPLIIFTLICLVALRYVGLL